MVRIEPNKMRIIGVVVVFSLAMAGCVPSLSTPVVTAPAGPQGPAPISGWLAGPIGQQLDDADRERAFAAQIAAAETGRRASWRSTKGHFGFVEPGAEGAGAGGTCRPFTHTVYIDGRAQRGTGSACRNAAGAWNVVS